MKLTDTQLAILRFIELADGEGSILSRDIADQLGMKPRGMGNRLKELERCGLVRRVIARPRASWRSDNLYAWCLTNAGREAGSRSRILAAWDQADGPRPIEQVRQRRSA